MKQIEEKGQLHVQSASKEAQLLKSYMVIVDMDEVDVKLIEKLFMVYVQISFIFSQIACSNHCYLMGMEM